MRVCPNPHFNQFERRVWTVHRTRRARIRYVKVHFRRMKCSTADVRGG